MHKRELEKRTKVFALRVVPFVCGLANFWPSSLHPAKLPRLGGGEFPVSKRYLDLEVRHGAKC